MRIFFTCCFLLFTSVPILAQVNETFSDADFTNNPVWSGSNSDFIVNAALQLQSNNTTANSSYYLSTASTLATEAEWEFYCQLSFNTSSANYVDIYLTASAANLSAAGTSGYVLRIGGTDDEISLYRKSATGTFTKIIDGTDDITNSSNNILKIKITRNAANVWVLYIDETGTGNNYTADGSVTDAGFTTSAFFGIFIRHSTASFFQKHFFDDIRVAAYVPDTQAPAIVSSTVLNANTVEVLFDEPVDPTTASILTNYTADNGLGNPISATVSGSNPAWVTLVFANNFPANTNVTLTVNGVEDMSGNAINNGSTQFVYSVTPPEIVSAIALDNQTVQVLFNEDVELTSSQNTSNYTADNGIGNPVSAVRDAGNHAMVQLSFATPFANAVLYNLTIENVQDLQGTPMSPATVNFSFYTPQRFDILINEIMADFSPAISLPTNEWVELKNNSDFAIDVQGWRISDESGTSGPMPAHVIPPGGYLIVCTGSAVAALSAYGPTVSVTSFPSMNDAGENIYISNANNDIIHSVRYSSDWYNNELKRNGGWSLEMIDNSNPCSGKSNWTASNDPRGGTPGEINSVNAINPDNDGPKLLHAFLIDPTHLRLQFDEPLDITAASTVTNYSVSDGIGTPLSALPQTPDFSSVVLELNTALQDGTIYTVTMQNVSDCVGNSSGNTSIRTGTIQSIEAFDIVVNEILFNAKSGGTDFVEIYNRSNKIVNLKNIYLANRNSSNDIANIMQLSTEDIPFFPGEFRVATENIDWVKLNYVSQNPDAYILMPNMPSYNDDEGHVILLNEQGILIDEISYDEDWHFDLISDKEGVSLERINYHDTTLDVAMQKNNWHSAASSVGYGTPTYKNSQYRIDAELQAEITLEPKTISPDNDGFDDFATIYYKFPEPGNVASITIFDAVGRPVRYLQRNALNGTSGFYRWDGLGEKQAKLPTGMYIIYTEVLSPSGKSKRFKNVIVLARRR